MAEAKAGVVLGLSGGLESAILLAYAIREFGRENVFPLSFDYGQANMIELTYARKLCDFYNIELRLITLSRIFREDNTQDTLPKPVPSRNLNFLALLTAYAQMRNVAYMWICQNQDSEKATTYPDNRLVFFESLAATIFLGTNGEISLHMPFCHLNKAGLIEFAFILNAPLDLTQTCSQGKRPACGVCKSCKERLNAFTSAKFVDPLAYDIIHYESDTTANLFFVKQRIQAGRSLLDTDGTDLELHNVI